MQVVGKLLPVIRRYHYVRHDCHVPDMYILDNVISKYREEALLEVSLHTI